MAYEKNDKRLLPLDGMRGIASIGIAIFWHYLHFGTPTLPFGRIAFWFYHYGYLCVSFFFVLSGFVMSYVYGESIRSGSMRFARYIGLRLSRLYPLMVATLLVVALIQWGRMLAGYSYFVYPHNDIFHFVLNLFMMQKGWFESGWSFNAPSWSVSCEMVAYFFFYFAWMRRQHPWAYFCGLLLIGLSVMKINLNWPIFNAEMATMFVCFSGGVLTYFVHEHAPRWIICGWCGVTFFSCCMAIWLGHSFWGDSLEWRLVYMLLIFPGIILWGLHVRQIGGLLSLWPFTYLGDISYSIYLWHFPVQLIIDTGIMLQWISIDLTTKLGFFIYAGMVFGVGIMSFHFFEMPMRKWLRKRYNL